MKLLKMPRAGKSPQQSPRRNVTDTYVRVTKFVAKPQKPTGIRLTVQQYCQAKGIREHQAAGFIAEAHRANPVEKVTFHEWVERMKIYRSRPV